MAAIGKSRSISPEKKKGERLFPPLLPEVQPKTSNSRFLPAGTGRKSPLTHKKKLRNIGKMKLRNFFGNRVPPFRHRMPPVAITANQESFPSRSFRIRRTSFILDSPSW